MSSCGLKPARVVSYLSDDSMSGEFPKRAYSVGSRPTTKPLRHHHLQDIQKKEVLDSRSSSAPHLIVQKSRSPYLDSSKYPNPYDAYLGEYGKHYHGPESGDILLLYSGRTGKNIRHNFFNTH